ncbi:hypothetical protein CMQ_5617 [Grosmannia clavigera kw1407]|uniref:Uncharacterized protein n=1 Tax=Grosmannia clavigera (strain kw1407 / UAMH 11150) TaxID=655863 RepID=F0XST6_GROCL|nr:uncharacterized protein CMQ_5617 [Grosmannia clavigera kw1407]EFW99196.1 hypothetical protein CMQ_5617 [Grosmannia clavigera kw1407]
MAPPHSILAVAGTLAIFSTSALIALLAILAHQLEYLSTSTTRIIAIVSAISEGLVLLIFLAYLTYFIWSSIRRQAAQCSVNEKQLQKPLQQPGGHWFSLSILLCTVAAAISVAALVNLSKFTGTLPPTLFGSGAVPFLAGASVTLSVCYTAQLLFLIAQYIAVRALSTEETTELSRAAEFYKQDDASNRPPTTSTRISPSIRVKGIRYSQTLAPTPPASRRGGIAALTGDIRSPPGSSDGRSAAETFDSLRSSLSNAVRPFSSRTRLLASSSGSLQSLRTLPSYNNSSSPRRDRESSASVEDDFDSWDTSSVSPQNRQAVLESSMSPIPASRFLETIPASPTASRCPSPGAPLDLAGPPRTRRRSRSYSPVPRSVPRSTSTTSLSSGYVVAPGTRARSHSLSPANEAHIHPLFRSDSPTPPPAVSAGTVVTAAPNAGQMLATDVQSLRTFNRIRSGSLPVVSSPLSRQGSFDDFAVKRALAGSPSALGDNGGGGIARGRPLASDMLHDKEEEVDEEVGTREKQLRLAERNMTPPIPDWILSAGTRTSLSGYESRNSRLENEAS